MFKALSQIRNLETPFVELSSRAFFKFEFLHYGRSHKARAVNGILDAAEAQGRLIRNSGAAIIEKTGGNLGVALTLEGLRRGYSVDLAVGLSFSERKKDLLRSLGANLIGIDLLNEGKSPKEVIEHYLERGERDYIHLDQFSETGSYLGQYESLGAETLRQIKQQGLEKAKWHIVKGAGTGASAQGLFDHLDRHGLEVELHIVQPKECDLSNDDFSDHKIQGIAVGRYPPFLNKDSVSSYVSVEFEQAQKGCETLRRNFGLFCGLTSGANYFAVTNLFGAKNNDEFVISVLYDRGEDY